MSTTERDWSAELTAYIDGELSEADVTALEAALAADPKLRALEQRLRATIKAVEALPAPAPASAALRRSVLAKVGEPTFGEKVRAWLTPPRLVPIGLAMAATVAAIVVWQKPAGDEFNAGDEEQLLLAQHMEVVEDMDLVGLDQPDDLEVVAALHELEVER